MHVGTSNKFCRVHLGARSLLRLVQESESQRTGGTPRWASQLSRVRHLDLICLPCMLVLSILEEWNLHLVHNLFLFILLCALVEFEVVGCVLLIHHQKTALILQKSLSDSHDSGSSRALISPFLHPCTRSRSFLHWNSSFVRQMLPEQAISLVLTLDLFVHDSH